MLPYLVLLSGPVHRAWHLRLAAFSAGGDGGRRSPEHPLIQCDDVCWPDRQGAAYRIVLAVSDWLMGRLAQTNEFFGADEQIPYSFALPILMRSARRKSFKLTACR